MVLNFKQIHPNEERVPTWGSSEDNSGITYTTKDPHGLSLSVCRDRSASKEEQQERQRERWTHSLIEKQNICIWRADNTSPAAVCWFRASSSMTVAVRYFVSYLYINTVSSEHKIIWDNYYSASVNIKLQTALVNHRPLCVPHPLFVSVGFSSAVLASQCRVQTQPLHQHLTVAAKKNGTFDNAHL